ncbi:ATP-grasp domain-containing protein [Candidatus Woesearchaeota archaeon]|nr:ATP-grasp domain-containing protein [Candidatus Woesearchaeota archaeon]
METTIYPQMLGFDIVKERSTGRKVILEINGQMSGYSGIPDPGQRTIMSGEMLMVLADYFPNSRVLANLDILQAVSGPIRPVMFEKTARNLGLEIDNIVLDDEFHKSPQDFESDWGINLRDYGCLLGFGSFFSRDVGVPMINHPYVEKMTGDKLLLSQVLAEVGGVVIPKTIYRRRDLAALRDEFATLVLKPRHGAQGEGVEIVSSQGSLERLSTFLSRSSHIVQGFVESEPVLDPSTGQSHYARARVIWFGKYIGGYWGLSSNPVTPVPTQDAVVNYCRTQKSVPFTSYEEQDFKDFVEDVAPKIVAYAQVHVPRLVRERRNTKMAY